MKDKIISAILVSIIIGLISLIGFLGYTIYSEIVGEGVISLSFSDEAGYPTIQYNPTNIDTSSSKADTNMFSGVGEGKNQTENTNKKVENGFLYSQLDKTAQLIYNKLYENKENLKTGTYTVEFGNAFSELLSEEGGDVKLQKQYQSAIEALVYENPDIFYLNATNMYINIEKITKITGVKYNVYIDQGKKTSYLADGFYSKEDVNRYQKEIEQERDKILAEVSGKSDYEKIKEVHDYLVDTIDYDSTVLGDNIYNIYGALVTKKCVCEGYAKAFQYLMNELNIENVIVIGTGTNSKNESENHAWNYVKLGENWYAVDVTWDDPIIIGGGKLTKDLRYQYFLKGERTMSKNHISSGSFTDGGQVFKYPVLSQKDY